MILRDVEWLECNEVRLFFSTGLILETKLPCRSAKQATVIDFGLGLKFGAGMNGEMSARALSMEPGNVLFGRRPSD